MITPLDVQGKEFRKSVMGYSSKEVDIYLDDLGNSYEKVYKENIELKDKIGMLTDQIRQYNNLEETLKNTLVIAQSTADDVTSSARKKAELIVEEAELKSKSLINEANEEVKKIMKEYDHLKKEIFIFKTRYESFVKAQLISIDEFYKDYENKSTSKEVEEIGDLENIDDLGA